MLKNRGPVFMAEGAGSSAKKKDAAPKDTKKSAAMVIVKQYNATDTTKELVSRLMDDVPGKMTQQGARTYVYNCRKDLGLEAKARPKAAKKAPAEKKPTTKKEAAGDKPKTARKRTKSAAKKAPATKTAVERSNAHAAAINED
jgi:ATP phosphoribosyltransferase